MNQNEEKILALEKAVSDIYLVADPGLVRLECAVVIANRMKIDPVWLFIVAPSGAGKTEFITAIDKTKGVFPISSLTSKTFISGQKKKNGQETSLLLRVQYGIFTFKDFTSILSMHKDERIDIIGQLREIYDGEYIKRFGTGDDVRWKGKMGLIAGTTPIVYTTREMWSAMGERFMMYMPLQPDRLEVARRTLSNIKDMRSYREEIKERFRKYLDEDVQVPDEIPEIGSVWQEELIHFADLGTRARSVAERDWYSPQREVISLSPPEVPTRFAAQLKAVASALIVISGRQDLPEHERLTEDDKQIIRKLAMDCISPLKRAVLKELARYESVSSSGLAVKIGLPASATRKAMEDFAVFGVVERAKSGQEDQWFIKEEFRVLIAQMENIVRMDGHLDKDSASDDVRAARGIEDPKEIAKKAKRLSEQQQLKDAIAESSLGLSFAETQTPLPPEDEEAVVYADEANASEAFE